MIGTGVAVSASIIYVGEVVCVVYYTWHNGTSESGNAYSTNVVK